MQLHGSVTVVLNQPENLFCLVHLNYYCAKL